MREIWLASKSGGYHFKSIDGEWICSKTGLELLTLLKQECDKHADEPIDWV
ncbi:frataxin-like protein [Vibrio cholerae]|nr:frataxin-like protein [Vibrio cholerae]CSC55426.1 frataxin-like protein [Vibrio cholerae]CSC76548.1 frataxin-like protein [Vibrio cholerae]